MNSFLYRTPLAAASATTQLLASELISFSKNIHPGVLGKIDVLQICGKVWGEHTRGVAIFVKMERLCQNCIPLCE